MAELTPPAITTMLGQLELADGIRPELWKRVEQLLAERAIHQRAERARATCGYWRWNRPEPSCRIATR